MHLATEALALYEVGDREALLAFVDARLAAQPEEADVVHDLLAFLAETLIDLHAHKGELTARFWLDLEGVAEDDAFETLRNRGKQGRSLWKAEACRAFVEEESYSSHSLDEALGWSEACYKAFVKMLPGKITNLADLVGVYRKYTPEVRALKERIAATDRLIDAVVYRLYGLTDEEIAIVEGE